MQVSMNYFLIQAIPIAEVSSEDSSFWMQILVFLLLAASWGLYSLVKNNRNKDKAEQQNIAEKTGTGYSKLRRQFRLPRTPSGLRTGIVQEYIARMKDKPEDIGDSLQEPISDFADVRTAGWKNAKNKPVQRSAKDLQSGMELLELDFLLSIIENTEGNEHKDVTMRKLNFNELIRREKLSRVSSRTLKVYAVNRNNLYGKDIQCEAIKELSKRTTHTNSREALQPVVSFGEERTADVK